MNAVFMIWILTYATSGGMDEKRYIMPNMEVCNQAVKSAQIKIPQGGDAESTISIFCAYKIVNLR